MSRRSLLIAAIVLLLVAVYFVFGRQREVCTVCLKYGARASCATASGGTAATAVEKAQRRACSKVAAADSLARCLALPPASVQCRS